MNALFYILVIFVFSLSSCTMPGSPEMIWIFVVVLLLFGGRKIPELMRGIGKGIRELNNAKDGIQKEFEEGMNEKEGSSSNGHHQHYYRQSQHKIEEEDPASVPRPRKTTIKKIASTKAVAFIKKENTVARSTPAKKKSPASPAKVTHSKVTPTKKTTPAQTTKSIPTKKK